MLGFVIYIIATMFGLTVLFLPVPNDLLNDTDQALEAYLRQWIAKKSIATVICPYTTASVSHNVTSSRSIARN
ncbi:hypothetical protein ACT4US_26015, partial [Bacillus sp. HC-Mk]